MSGKKIILMLLLIGGHYLIGNKINASDVTDSFKTPTKNHASISSAGQSTKTPGTPNSGEVINLLNITLGDLKAEGGNFTTEQQDEFKRVSLKKFRDLIAAMNKSNNEKIKNEMIFLIESEIATLGTRDELLKKIDELEGQLKAYKNKDDNIIASPTGSINFDTEALRKKSPLFSNTQIGPSSTSINYDPEALNETSPLFNKDQIEYPKKTNNWDYLKTFIKSFGAGLGASAGAALSIFLFIHFSK